MVAIELEEARWRIAPGAHLQELELVCGQVRAADLPPAAVVSGGKGQVLDQVTRSLDVAEVADMHRASELIAHDLVEHRVHQTVGRAAHAHELGHAHTVSDHRDVVI